MDRKELHKVLDKASSGAKELEKITLVDIREIRSYVAHLESSLVNALAPEPEYEGNAKGWQDWHTARDNAFKFRDEIKGS